MEELERGRQCRDLNEFKKNTRYRSHAQLQEEQEELEIAVELEKLRNQQELAELLED